MTHEVFVTHAARADAEGIVAWIVGRGHPTDARRWFDALFRTLLSLAEYPERHACVLEDSELGPLGVRALLFGEYRALYVVRGSEVLVLHIRHGMRRDISRAELVERLGEADSQREARAAERDLAGDE